MWVKLEKTCHEARLGHLPTSDLACHFCSYNLSMTVHRLPHQQQAEVGPLDGRCDRLREVLVSLQHLNVVALVPKGL